MKKIMNYLSMAALALVGAVMTGCNSEDNIVSEPQQPQDKSNVVPLTTTVSFDDADGAATRALAIDYTAKTLTKTFAAGDQIAVIYQNTGGTTSKAVSEALTAGGKSATFSVTLENQKENGSVKYIYPAAMAGDTDVDYTKLASQDGTLATIASNYDLAVFEGTLSGTALPASATLENKLAIIAYTIKDNADTPNDLTSTVTNLKIGVGSNSYSVTRSAAAGPIYVAIQPTSAATIAYIAYTTSNAYAKSVTSKTYAKGNFYQLGLKMAEGITSPVLGQVVGSDGKNYATATDATAAGTTAVAMIAYVADNGKSGLAIALADDGSKDWATAISTCEGKAAAGGYLWHLPSQDEWKAMFKANGDDADSCSGLNTAIGTAGGSALQEDDVYWSSTESDGDYAYYVYLGGGGAYWGTLSKDDGFLVRACLAF